MFTELGQPCGQGRPALEAGPSGSWGRGMMGRSRRGAAGGAEPGRRGPDPAAHGSVCEPLD